MFNGYSLSVGNDKNILGRENGGEYTTMYMYLTPPNCTLIHG